MNKLNICVDCMKDRQLKMFFKDNKEKVKDKCAICDKLKECIPVNEELITLTRLLIRYHYPEYKYNTHHGGEYISDLFYNKNELYEVTDNDEFIDSFVGMLDSEENIKLYYGNYGCARGCFLCSIKEYADNLSFFKSVEERNSYLVEDEFKEKMMPIIKLLEKDIYQGEQYYRARLGRKGVELIYDEYAEETLKAWKGNTAFYDLKEYEKCGINDPFMLTSYAAEPYEDNDIGAPPVKFATEGRVNKAGISFLYLASDEETSLAEVKPSPGQYVSIGIFKNIKNLKVIDISDIKFYEIVKCEEDIRKLEFIQEMQSIFDRYALPDEKNPYLITQFIAEQIYKMGYDGIVFRSVMGNGINSVFFKPEDFIYVERSSQLIKINKVSFKYGYVNYRKNGYCGERIEEVIIPDNLKDNNK